ncbi:MAG: molybdate transport system ATP-binding protein [Paraglaciecola sp.]|jgi:molybdate transport system ATP-binding protein
MQHVTLTKLSAEFAGHFCLKNINWEVKAHQHWVIVGANGAGKSALAALLAGQGQITCGELSSSFTRVGLVSYEYLNALIELELKKDSADILDIVPVPTTVSEMLTQNGEPGDAVLRTDLCQRLLVLFNFESLLGHNFMDLSTGETRKLLLIKAIISQPQLLVLDEPFDGLDSATCDKLTVLLNELASSVTMIMVFNRLSEVPDFVRHYAFVEDGQLALTVDDDNPQQRQLLRQLVHLQHTEMVLPEPDTTVTRNHFKPGCAIVSLNSVTVIHPGKKVFENLNWQIDCGQHWQLSGPNGSGKTSLLQLITGDHPQCYSNDIQVFGYQRGSGESIWDIKQHIGLLSNALHLAHRVNCSVLHVILSGFFDSIGLYRQPTLEQRGLAQQWLILIGLVASEDQPFQQLSFGDQRLCLVARAMVKHPALLILDEPCNGLDDLNRQRVLRLIERICESQTTSVIYVNHHPDDKICGINQYFELGQPLF